MDDRPTRDPIREAHRQWVAHGWADAADATADAAKDAGNAVEGTVNAAGDAAAAAGDKIQEETKKAEANDK